MKKTAKVALFALVLSVVFGAASLTVPCDAMAQTQAQSAQDMSFNTSGSFKDNIKTFVGKDVYVSLRSGKIYQGYVKSVGDHLLHLEKIAGKDFYDALIRLEDISALEVKFRGLK
jgi:hypothetical protein